ncbi:MAG: hypothetical protein AAFU65_17500 [Pseudomonadota bacterium]
MKLRITNQPGNPALGVKIITPVDQDDQVAPDIEPNEVRVLDVHDDAHVQINHSGELGFLVEAIEGGNLLCKTYGPGDEPGAEVEIMLEVERRRIGARQGATAIQLSPREDGERVVIDRVVDEYAARQAAGAAH